MIILQGDIFYFGLSNLLKFLYSSKLTGVLRVRRKERSAGIFILSGKPVGVDTTREDPAAELVNMTAWLEGVFEFETLPEEDIQRNISVPADQLVLLLAKKENEIKALKNTLPPPETILIMNPAKKNGEIRLQPEEWNFLSKVDGKKTLEELVCAMDIDEISAYAIAAKMLQKDILVVSDDGSQKNQENLVHEDDGEKQTSKREKISDERIKLLEKTFMRYVGPMGTIILDEILESLHLTRDGIPMEKFPELIERLSLEIGSEEEKRSFEEEIIKVVNLKEGNL